MRGTAKLDDLDIKWAETMEVSSLLRAAAQLKIHLRWRLICLRAARLVKLDDADGGGEDCEACEACSMHGLLTACLSLHISHTDEVCRRRTRSIIVGKRTVLYLEPSREEGRKAVSASQRQHFTATTLHLIMMC